MDFQDFITHIPKIEQEILLGELAHQIMSPPERADLIKNLETARLPVTPVIPAKGGIQSMVELGAFPAIVKFSVAVWTYSDCICHCVFASMSKLSSVMHLQIRSAIFLSRKWRCL